MEDVATAYDLNKGKRNAFYIRLVERKKTMSENRNSFADENRGNDTLQGWTPKTKEIGMVRDTYDVKKD